MKMSAEKTEESKPINLFDYSEDDLLHSDPPILTHYEILNCAVYATQMEVKKAYRKASLKYHPDKTGRGDDDYVFLAVKAAHDTLMDHGKRQAYDSTVLPFDDSIPSAREKLIQDTMLLYSDDDFYSTFGPVFDRNLRFDARLRPDLVKGGNNKKVNQKLHNHAHPPTVGDANTPIDKVHEFYEYWVHFDSWRDFSAQAADELQIENELENAESRYEKRWIQKEIDKRAKALKRTEVQRIQLLVERAMEADPRLRKERLLLQQNKERAAAERIRKQKLIQEEKELEAKKLQEQEELDKIVKQEEKVQRDKDKKVLRKERQQLRKVSSTSFEFNNFSFEGIWNDSYEFSQSIDYLCNSLNLDSMKIVNTTLASYDVDDHNGILKFVYERIELEKQIQQKENEEQEERRSNGLKDEKSTAQASASTNNRNTPWTKEELSALAKGVKKFPPGGGGRWEAISLFVNNICKQQIPRSKEECIEKYNQIARDASLSNNSSNVLAHSSSNGSSSFGGNTSSATINGTVNGTLPISTNTDSKNPVGNGTSTVPKVEAPIAQHLQTEESVENGETTKEDDSAEVDVWSTEQDQQLQDALAKNPASMDKNERWVCIAKCVQGKTKKQCVQRFKSIREALQKSKK